MQIKDVPEINLWREVVIHAIRDAQSGSKKSGRGMEGVYKWTRSADCKEVCYLAQLDHDAVRIGFINLYLKYLNEELIFKENKQEFEIEVDEIKIKILKAYERLEKIKWQEI